MGSLYLCATPSGWSGMARLYDFGNTFDTYNYAQNREEADAISLLWDWAIVGESLRQAIAEHEALSKGSGAEEEALLQPVSR